jgi:hypothetical protein
MVPADTPAPTLCNPRASTRSYDAAANAPRSVAAAWRDAQQLSKVVRQKQAHHRASLAAWPREPLEVSDSRRPYFNHFPLQSFSAGAVAQRGRDDRSEVAIIGAPSAGTA